MATQTEAPLAVICAAFHVETANPRAFLFNFLPLNYTLAFQIRGSTIWTTA